MFRGPPVENPRPGVRARCARIFIDGRTFHKKRLVGKFKQRTNVQYHYKKAVPYQRTVPEP